ncbi:MAG: metallophosphoesterase family protein [Clostridia bacterium]|nr:metallophosphoesterase family protein [Clostridia bacterium]
MEKKIIGVISDTHGLLRPEAIKYLKDVDLIIHAGDVGSEKVLNDLKQIAPVYAVRGNCDQEEWAKKLPRTEIVEVASNLIYLIHDIQQINIDPKTAGLSIVIYGHSHRPAIDKKEGIYYLNPGSIGPKRFNLPISLAKIIIEDKKINIEIIEL